MNGLLREFLELPQDGWYSRWDVARQVALAGLGAVLLFVVVAIGSVYVLSLTPR